MKCCNESLIIEYLDGELSQKQYKRFEEHIKNCSKCRALLKEYKILYDNFEDIDLPEPEQDFTADVMTSLSKVDFKKKKVTRKVFLTIAAVFLLGVTAFGYWLPLQNMGPIWDVMKLFSSILYGIFESLGVILNLVLFIGENVLEGLNLLTGLLVKNSYLLVVLSVSMVLVEIIFIKYICGVKS